MDLYCSSGLKAAYSCTVFNRIFCMRFSKAFALSCIWCSTAFARSDCACSRALTDFCATLLDDEGKNTSTLKQVARLGEQDQVHDNRSVLGQARLLLMADRCHLFHDTSAVRHTKPERADHTASKFCDNILIVQLKCLKQGVFKLLHFMSCACIRKRYLSTMI